MERLPSSHVDAWSGSFPFWATDKTHLTLPILDSVRCDAYVTWEFEIH